MNTLLLAADTGGSYVAAAYLFFLVVMFVYIAIMAKKLAGLQQRLNAIDPAARTRQDSDS
jgi:hypothetical protein